MIDKMARSGNEYTFDDEALLQSALPDLDELLSKVFLQCNPAPEISILHSGPSGCPSDQVHPVNAKTLHLKANEKVKILYFDIYCDSM